MSDAIGPLSDSRRRCEIFICDQCDADWWIAFDLPMPEACDDCGGTLIAAFPEMTNEY